MRRIFARKTGLVHHARILLTTAAGMAFSCLALADNCTEMPVNGKVYEITNESTGLNIDVAYNYTNAGAHMHQWSRNGASNQQFKVSKVEGGYWTIHPMNNSNQKMVLDVNGASDADGARIIQWGYGEQENQQWSFEQTDSGSIKIVSRQSGKPITVAQNFNGSKVYQRARLPDYKDALQSWHFNPVKSSCGTSVGPVGFANGVTGGEGGEVVTVTTPEQLTAAVSGNEAKIIRISGIIDYRRTEGSATRSGCTYSHNYCNYNGKQEKILDDNGTGHCKGRNLYDITYDKAGETPLQIGSNKTLIGVGANSGIKGKGLRVSGGVSNIIIRNLSITDINDGTIFAGDALTINNASNIWIDHNYIARIGRQFIVTGWDTAQNVTISGNYLDGTTDYGHSCDQRHYWTALLVAENQSITMIGNRFSMTSGRAPKFGKHPDAPSSGILHMVNNYFDQNKGTAFYGDATATVLMEGNYYGKADGYRPISSASTGIPLYAPLDLNIGSTSSTCQSLLGRDCVSNYDENETSNFVINSSAMSAIQANSAWLDAVRSITPKSYSEVASQRFGPQANITY